MERARASLRKRLRVGGDVVGEKFQGYVAVEAGIFRLVHNAHPASPEFLYNPIPGDRFADHRCFLFLARI